MQFYEPAQKSSAIVKMRRKGHKMKIRDVDSIWFDKKRKGK